MEEKGKFIPYCFQKDINNFSSYFNGCVKSKNVFSKELDRSLPAKDIYTIIKNLDLSVEKLQKTEYKKSKVYINDAARLFRVSKNCDVYILKFVKKKFFFSSQSSYKVIRFYSYSSSHKSYFFLFNVVDIKDDSVKFFKGGIIIPENEKRVLIYVKSSKSRQNFTEYKNMFDLYVNNIISMFEEVGKFMSRKDIERLSTVETLESEYDGKYKRESGLSYKVESVRVSEEEDDSQCSGDLVDFDEDLGDHTEYPVLNIQDNSISQHNPFIHDENDEEFQKIRKLNENDLKELNLYDAFDDLRTQVKEDGVTSTDGELVRYIFGWKGQVQNIKANLIELNIWRSTFLPHKLTIEDFKTSSFKYEELMNIPCQDVYGRPIILLKAKNLVPSKIEIEEFVKYLIYILESGVRLMPNTVDKLLIVIDIQDAGLNNFSMSHINKIREITSKYYVERLANIIIINKGFFFGMLWSVVSKFLDDRVKRKIIVPDSNQLTWLRRILGDKANTILS